MNKIERLDAIGSLVDFYRDQIDAAIAHKNQKELEKLSALENQAIEEWWKIWTQH